MVFRITGQIAGRSRIFVALYLEELPAYLAALRKDGMIGIRVEDVSTGAELDADALQKKAPIRD